MQKDTTVVIHKQYLHPTGSDLVNQSRDRQRETPQTKTNPTLLKAAVPVMSHSDVSVSDQSTFATAENVKIKVSLLMAGYIELNLSMSFLGQMACGWHIWALRDIFAVTE